jgi:heterotetrameric sarcosine oxidase gamma subunit
MPDLSAAPALICMENIGNGSGVRAALRQHTVISVLARKGLVQTLVDRAKIADAPRQGSTNGITTLGIGPGRWLVLGATFEQLAHMSGFASLSDHSDGYAVFEVWGDKVRETLAKGVPVDLHPAVFTDDVAVTVIAHIGAVIWQSAPDHYSIAVFRSYARSFWNWLSASASEFGLTVEKHT